MFKKMFVVVLVAALLLVSGCAADNDSDVSEQEPYREYNGIKYDEKLGGAYQIVDIKIDNNPDEADLAIELYFVTDYSMLGDKGQLIFTRGSAFADLDDKDIPFNGERHESDLMGDEIVSAVGGHIYTCRIHDALRNKISIDDNISGLLNDSIYKVFRITERYDSEYDSYHVHFYAGTDIEDISPYMLFFMEENKFVFTYDY